jgi:hypothetical protein
MRWMMVTPLVLVTIAGCGSSTSTTSTTATSSPSAPASSPSAAAGNPGLVLARKLTGTFKGTWKDTKYKSTGAATFVFVLDESAKTFDTTLTLGGPALGGSGAGTETYKSLPIDMTNPSKIAFTATSAKFGPINVTFDSSGSFVAVLPSFPAGKTTFTGTADGTTIQGTAVVVQSDGMNAGGPLTLTKQ